FNNHAPRTDLHLLDQTANAKPGDDFSFFPVNLDLHWNQKKPYPRRPPKGGQGIRFQVCPALIARNQDFDSHCSLSRAQTDTPSMGSTLNTGLLPSQIPADLRGYCGSNRWRRTSESRSDSNVG